VLFMSHVGRLLGSLIQYSLTTRRVGLLIAIVVGVIAVSAAFATSAAVPVVVYPFV